MGDIFREIDEELRQERLAKLWKDYGKYILIAVVVVVVAVAGVRGWMEYRDKQRADMSAKFAAAVGLVNENKGKEAAALFDSLAGKDGAYGTLARFEKASLRLKDKDIKGAVAIYDAIAADGDVSRPLRDAAIVLSVMHAMNLPNADGKALEARLKPLEVPGGAWRSAATELSGLLALKAGDKARAVAAFKSITDDTSAPANTRARAAQLLAVIGG